MDTSEKLKQTEAKIGIIQDKFREIIDCIPKCEGSEYRLYDLADQLDDIIAELTDLLIPGTYVEDEIDVLHIKAVYGLAKAFQAVEDWGTAVSFYQIAAYEMTKRNCLMGLAKARCNIAMCYYLGIDEIAENIRPYTEKARDAIKKARLLSKDESQNKTLTELEQELASISV